MSDDPQDSAEQFDEDLLGGDTSADGRAVTSDEASVDVPPDHPLGLPFADADVTDESLADRVRQEEPEVWERRRAGEATVHDSLLGDSGAADEQLEQIIDLTDTPPD